MVTIVAEFVAGGIRPWYRIEAIRLFTEDSLFGYVIKSAEILFAVSTFYYMVNMIVVMKKEGVKEYFSNSWNLADIFTMFLSIIALILYVIRMFAVDDMTKEVN